MLDAAIAKIDWPMLLVPAVGTAVLLFPTSSALARLGVVDHPNTRSSHKRITVRGAGVAIVLTISIALSIADRIVVPAWWLLGATLILAIISFIDDVRGLPPVVRFGVQMLVAGLAISGMWQLSVQASMSMPMTAAGIGVSWLWIVGYTNAYNFMDGINGIAAIQAIVTALGTAAIGTRLGISANHPTILLSLVIAGAALGFLPHNFPRARVFMGDVGSATLGFLLALLAVWVAGLTKPWVLFWVALLHANFVLDTSITLVRRASRRERLSEAHREHFYQRLVRAGYSHTSTTLTEFALQCLVAFALWWATPAGWVVKGAVAGGVFAIWVGFFVFAEAKFRAAMARVPQHPETLKC
jgi:UDP-N-acetylmuramyl pentapeptide phosphotransferase/UDP-N-acetylglucosamine-1-phosphate transferase